MKTYENSKITTSVSSQPTPLIEDYHIISLPQISQYLSISFNISQYLFISLNNSLHLSKSLNSHILTMPYRVKLNLLLFYKILFVISFLKMLSKGTSTHSRYTIAPRPAYPCRTLSARPSAPPCSTVEWLMAKEYLVTPGN